jgi:integrase
MLRDHRRDQADLHAALGAPPPGNDDLVFARLDGSPWPPDTITHAWRKLARRNGFGGVRLHDARHTHATLLLKGGVHPKIVQERLGHATIATTLDTYSHVAPGLQEAAALRFDALLGRQPAGEPGEPAASAATDHQA